MIKGKSAEEIRRTFNITNDFTPEEEAQIKKENVSDFYHFYYIYIFFFFLLILIIISGMG
jgi:hypothetical protein